MLIAIYSRKSKWTGKGESVENQIIMCREYIAMFIEEGDKAQIIEYEDEGFSGKDTNRPMFRKMMRDMQERHFDYLVCYKLDRLGRNLADLANLMEDLNRRGTSFISIKEKFDTTTPIGKAMLYFSGVLAQMEREQIAERVKDNMIMLARSGRWLGGTTPFGYSSVKVEKEVGALKKKSMFCLIQNPAEIDLARFIFAYFMEKRSLTKVLEYLLAAGIRTRSGKEFYISGIRDILVNPVYCIADEEGYQYFYDLGCQVCIDPEELDHTSGLMGYAKTTSTVYRNQGTPCESWIISMGRHKGIVTGKEFVSVQQLLASNRSKGDNFRDSRNSTALLSGLLYCTCGHRMRPKNYPASRVTEKGERTFSYRCPYKDLTHRENCDNQNVHGNTLDAAVCREVTGLAKPDAGILPMLEALRKQIEDSDIKVMSEKELISQEYEKKKDEIRKLVASLRQLEPDSVSVRYINEEIRRLDEECTALWKRMETGQDQQHEKKETADSYIGMEAGSEVMESGKNRDIEKDSEIKENKEIREITEKLADFSRVFEELPILQKRDFLREVIERVVWDGETAHIYLGNMKSI